MIDDYFAIYRGKEFTAGKDRNGKVILRSTDIKDVDNGFEKCEPFKYRKQEKLEVSITGEQLEWANSAGGKSQYGIKDVETSEDWFVNKRSLK